MRGARVIVLALVGLVLAACATGQTQPAGAPPPAPPAIPPAVTPLAVTPLAPSKAQGQAVPWRLISAREAADMRHLIVTVQGTRGEAAVRRAAELAEDLGRAHGLELVAEWPLGSIDVHCLVFRVADPGRRATVLAALARDPRVRTAQPMQSFRTFARTTGGNLEALQSSLSAMDVPAAHRVATGRDVRVAIIDTGLDTAHPELVGRLEPVRDLVGTEGAAPAEHHGTALAGVIGAEAASGQGVTGVAPDAMLVGLRACWEDRPGAQGRCSSFSLARALNLAIVQQVDVINLSLAGPPDPLLEELVQAAIAADIVVVAAWASGQDRAFPGHVEGVLPVGTAEDPAPGPPLVAPAIDVLTTAPGGGFDFVSGRSVATAHVTGLVALLREVRPGLSPADVRSAVLGRAVDRRADACGALLAVLDSGSPATCRP